MHFSYIKYEPYTYMVWTVYVYRMNRIHIRYPNGLFFNPMYFCNHFDIFHILHHPVIVATLSPTFGWGLQSLREFMKTLPSFIWVGLTGFGLGTFGQPSRPYSSSLFLTIPFGSFCQVEFPLIGVSEGWTLKQKWKKGGTSVNYPAEGLYKLTQLKGRGLTVRPIIVMYQYVRQK
jgi:hypothetical protein